MAEGSILLCFLLSFIHFFFVLCLHLSAPCSPALLCDCFSLLPLSLFAWLVLFNCGCFHVHSLEGYIDAIYPMSPVDPSEDPDFANCQ